MNREVDEGRAASVGDVNLRPVYSGLAPPADNLGVCVGIASLGRPAQVVALVEHLGQQTLQPDRIIISCGNRGDAGSLKESESLKIVEGRPGLARQRNAVLDNLPDRTEFVVFFDDDFYPHSDWLRVAVQAFRADPTVACLTGNVIADGILGPGLNYEDAKRALNQEAAFRHQWVVEGYSPYGCNMAFRRSAIEGLRFDERLVLYGWLEDRDFGARVARDRGRLLKLGAAMGVHLGVKGGRVSGRRLGYSQVMNPVYMYRKRTMTPKEAVRQVSRNVCMNVARSLWQEDHVDRRGRLIGNMVAVVDVLAGKCNPERAEHL